VNEEIKMLSNEQLDSVIQFSQGLYNGFNGGYGFFATPYSQYRNLISINNNPAKPTYDKLAKALESAPYDYQALSSYSEFMEIWDAIYAKTLRYFEGLLAFDLSYQCTNVKNASEYKTKEYQDDVKRVNKFLDKFDYKSEFRKVVKEIMRKETSYVWFRDSQEINTPLELEDDENKIKKTERFGLQIMPDKYCILTGYFNSGQLLYDFNMNYFLNATVDINLFAPIFKKKFKEVFNSDETTYNPSAQLDYRTGEFATWVQTSPLDGAWAFKFDLSNFRQIPPLANLMKGCLDKEEAQALQKDKNMISAYLVLAGEIATMSTEKSGNKADQFKINPLTMGKFMSLVNQGLKNNLKPIALPLEDIKGWQFNDSNVNMVENQEKITAADGASATTLIYTSDKMSQFELENAIYSDYCFMKPLYDQFNQFLNFYVNKKTKKYKFEFFFDGLDRQWDREKRQNVLRNYADKGIVLDSTMWASALGMKPQAFQRSLECAHNSNFIDNLTMLLNANTMKNGGGQDIDTISQKESTEKSDKTEEVQDYVK
jgi:hypothetical protein